MQWAQQVSTIRVVGTGVMGRGIAQLAATAGLDVELADVSPEAVSAAVDHVQRMLDKLVSKGKLTAEQEQGARARLHPVDSPTAVPGRRPRTRLLLALAAAILLTDLVTKIVVVATIEPGEDIRVLGGLLYLTHQPVQATDTPGFLVNHAGRGLVTEALQILGEGLAQPAEVDRICRDVLGLKMGPFELLDLTGLDVSHPVLESIWSGFYNEPRLRPSRITRARMEAGLLGRKSGRGFFDYAGKGAS